MLSPPPWGIFVTKEGGGNVEHDFEFLTWRVVRKGGTYRASDGAACPKDPDSRGPTPYTYIQTREY